MEKKTVTILGMMCAGCSARVERRLNELNGILSAKVNLPTRTALIEYDPKVISLNQMKAELIKTGYDMIIEEDTNIEAIERQAYKTLRTKVFVSWGLALLTMLATDHQTMFILALLNLIYCGRPFYVSAWRQLLHGSANMDTLIALSTAVAFLTSAFNTFFGDYVWKTYGIEWHTYFDASVMIISFVLTGRLLEERTKHSITSAIRTLMGLQPKTAHLVDNTGTITNIPIGTLGLGDTLEVRPEERIPADGTVIGEYVAYIDESMITGEPNAVEKHSGEKVLAGTLVKEGILRFKADKVGQRTMLAHIIRMVQEAQGSKAPVQRVVDRIALIFVPMVVTISILTLLLWLFIPLFAIPELPFGTFLPQAILSAVSVLVIACPCAMGLATPTALMVGLGKAAERNILIKDATALELLRRVDAMIFDKTGTLTELNETGEKLKPHAYETIETLTKQGIEVWMCSGDRDSRANAIAAEVGIVHYKSQVLPQDKEDLVRHLQTEGKHVAMIGDGINDAQALAAADVSIAMGQGTDVAMEVSQVTLLGTDLRRIPEAINLSRRTVGMIHQNLFWAFIYNLVCIPLAAGVLHLFGISWQITPMWASALMAFSSISVVLNSLRLKYTK